MTTLPLESATVKPLSERLWLVRTLHHQIKGPYSVEALRELICKGTLGPGDEVCAGNHYWFRVDDAAELWDQLQIRLASLPIQEEKTLDTDLHPVEKKVATALSGNGGDAVEQTTMMVVKPSALNQPAVPDPERKKEGPETHPAAHEMLPPRWVQWISWVLWSVFLVMLGSLGWMVLNGSWGPWGKR